jgi:2'-5' RNA ligase
VQYRGSIYELLYCDTVSAAAISRTGPILAQLVIYEKESFKMALLKYSVWLKPTGIVNRKFSQLISQLAERYSSPAFPPHVTLIGSIEAHEEEIIGKAHELASLIQPYTIKLMNVDYTDDYYRALFVRVEPSAGVLAAYEQARKLFPSNEASYMPHLSLLYGDFSVETKKKIIKKVGDRFTDEFEVNTLHLYLTEGDADSWHKVREFLLRV